MSAHRLTSHEHAALGDLGTVVDCRRVRLYRDALGCSGLLRRVVLGVSRNRAIALGNHVFLPDRGQGDLALLAHELTHCAQYQAWGPLKYFTRGATAQLRHLLYQTVRIGSNPYQYGNEPLKRFEAYGMEQQGQIVEDSFRGHPVARIICPFHPGREPGD
jgi:uncharacterized protein DUF4157